MNQSEQTLPQLFKGIALLTPGGDLIYCIDAAKEGHWHLHLCIKLQELLGLPEPPHFLIPCYTATIDRWRDPRSQEICVAAEAYPPVLQYQTLLNAIFRTGDLRWQAVPWIEGMCDPRVLATYYERFPQLWTDHDLIVKLDNVALTESSQPFPNDMVSTDDSLLPQPSQGYVLRLFVSGHSTSTEQALKRLHKLLGQSLSQPYTLKVIDVVQHPDQAEQNQVAATPTLVRVWPQPMRRIVGSLENVESVLRILGVSDS